MKYLPFILLSITLFAFGCGQKGPLYLPQDPINPSESLASDQGESKPSSLETGEDDFFIEQE